MSASTTRTLCQCCHNNCGLLVSKDGAGRLRVTGDPDHPMNRGWICSKAKANVLTLDAPDRLTEPLSRTRGGFEKISWDQALDMAADRLGEIREKHGPLALCRYAGAPVSYLARDGFLQFMGAYGSPNLTSIANLCMAPRMMAFKAVTGALRAEPDYANTDMVLFWGSDPVGVGRYSAYAAHDGIREIIPRLKERGVRLAVIDPFSSKTAKTCDLWLRPNPGTDAALGLAMIRVILEEGLYDRAFADSHIHGLEALRRRAAPCTTDWAQEITGVPAEDIASLARSYAGAKAAAIYEGNGLDMYAGGVDAVRTIASLIALTGNLDAPGGNALMPMPHPPVLPAAPAAFTPDLIKRRIWHDRFPLPPQVPFPAIKESLLADEENRPRAMIVHHGNPVLIQANPARTAAALDKLDFLMVCDVFPTATSARADLILPMASSFESYGYRAYSSAQGGFFALARPVARPRGASRSVFEAEYELARRLGLEAGYPFKDARSWVDFMISPQNVSVARLEAEQIVFALPPVRYRKYLEEGFATPSGKAELASLWFESQGADPVPRYAPPAGEPLDREELAARGFPLLGSSRRPPQFTHTRFKNLPGLSKAYPEPLAYAHPDDAAKRNIAEGDPVQVFSPHGSIRLRARLSGDVAPGQVFVDFGWGNPSDAMASINDLTDDQRFDPYSGGTPNRLFPCELEKRSG